MDDSSMIGLRIWFPLRQAAELEPCADVTIPDEKGIHHFLKCNADVGLAPDRLKRLHMSLKQQYFKKPEVKKMMKTHHHERRVVIFLAYVCIQIGQCIY